MRQLDFRLAPAIVALFLILIGSQTGMAQTTTGEIRGTVTDVNGSAVAGASVIARNQGTNVENRTTTTGEGVYAIPNLIPGRYSIIVESPGFKRSITTDVSVNLGQITTVDVVLQPGGVQESVTVTAGAEVLLQRDQSQLSTTIESRRMAELPVNVAGAGLDVVALSVPGVFPGFGNVNSNGITLSVNGQRARSNNFTIDGMDNNDLSIGGPSFFIDNADLVGELQIITNNFSAQYGRNQGAIVNYVTKSGTNEFHGSAFVFRRDRAVLDSLNNIERRSGQLNPPRLKYTVLGGTLGGPIIRDRAFFFVSFQKILSQAFSQLRTTSLAILPQEFPRLLQAFPNNPAIQAYVNYSAFALTRLGEVRPRSDRPIETVVLGGQSFQAAAVERLFSSPYEENLPTIRGDVNLTNKDKISARYLFQKGTGINALGTVGGFFGDQPAQSKNFGASYIRQVSNTSFNEFRFAYQSLFVKFGGGCDESLLECIPDPSNIGKAFTNITFTGIRGTTTGQSLLAVGPATNLPQGRIVTTYQFADNFSFTFGRHSLMAGVDIRHLTNTVPFLPNINGAFSFNTADRLIANNPAQVVVAVGPDTISYKENDYYFFFQDDWKVRDNLTLNLGIRYELPDQPINTLHDLTVARESDPNQAIWRQSLPLTVRTIPFIPRDKNNWAPRFGFAWTPRFGSGLLHKLVGEEATVIRGGYGIAYDPSFYNIMLNISTASPVVFLQTITNPAGSPIFPLPSANPTGDVVRNFAQSRGLVQRNTFDPRFFTQTIVASNFHSPYSQQFSLGIQRQIDRNNAFEIRYVGTRGVGLFQTVNRNPDISRLYNGFSVTIGNTTFNFPAFRQFIPQGITPLTCTDNPNTPDNEGVCNGRILQQGLLRSRENTAQSTYHSLQTYYNGRLFNQLNLTVSYTWSKALDNASEIFAFGEQATSQNPFDLNKLEKSISGFDRRHALSLSYIWELPFFREQRGFIGQTLGGWQISGTYFLGSGRPFTASQQLNSLLGTRSYVDNTFNLTFFGNWDNVRPFTGNPKADPRSAAITDIDAALRGLTNGYVPSPTGFYSLNAFNQGRGAVPVSINDVRFIINGPGAAMRFGTPFGTEPRNSLRGPILNQLNLSIFKTFAIPENIKLQLRLEMFNALNHPNPGAGTASGDSIPPGNGLFVDFAGSTFNERGEFTYARRIIQLGMRLIF
ncbi:TonB-dependent receptor [Pyrinomonas methylaliphatogenes]|uniref:Carboxypeptidase regulatory-like domain n=1 Tax=Pyrinomonas methylaliphatogenes TaxID=454194 RepID=A0A0B6WUK1_9BACT|nr:carboxypeptidase regulatory-like domain-containing protein [Pyrinomonas methylaliphatogenes]CDM64377.1 Carboxypeptidase regulatory-like domain [Pyrinomonas methylaliphatogenes]